MDKTKTVRAVAGVKVRAERKELRGIVQRLMRDYITGSALLIAEPLGPNAPDQAQACAEVLARFRRHVRQTNARKGGSGRK